jgi:hypothetical protein
LPCGVDAEGAELLQVQHLRAHRGHQHLDAVDLQHGHRPQLRCRPPIMAPLPV